MAKQPFKETPRARVPAYMVSFGDMMTLILTFFILLVSMAEEQNEGLMAKGLGSFAVAINSYGLSGIMSEQAKAELFDDFRRRFNLPPEEDPEQRAADFDDASRKELVRAELAEGLEPHHELFQPMIATFSTGSAELDEASRGYIDRLAATFRPVKGQTLLLEGHASDGGADRTWLAYRRAAAVRQYLIDEHRFQPSWVEARAWIEELQAGGLSTRSVDARLLTPGGED